MPVLSFKVPDNWQGFEWLAEAEKAGWTRSALFLHIVEEFISTHGGPPSPAVKASEGSATIDTAVLASAIVAAFKEAKVGEGIMEVIRDGMKDIARAQTAKPTELVISLNGNGYTAPANGHHADELPAPRAQRPPRREVEPELIDLPEPESDEDALAAATGNFLGAFG